MHAKEAIPKSWDSLFFTHAPLLLIIAAATVTIELLFFLLLNNPIYYFIVFILSANIINQYNL